MIRPSLQSAFLSVPRRGAAALAVSIVLLIGMTLVAFFVNRNLVFEQRTSANQYRATKAFEMAEAGMEWAVAQLNGKSTLAAALCTPATGTGLVSFANRYLTLDASGIGVIANGRVAGSMAANGSITPSCPAPGTAPAAGAATEPRFMVEFSKVGITDPFSVRIIARGCTNAGNWCVDGTTAGTAPDAIAVVTAIYKMKPALPTAPGAGLVAGGSATASGSMTVSNQSPIGGGITINSGSIVNLNSGIEVYSLPGTHPTASVLDNDFSLRDLTNADGSGEVMFASFMGQNTTNYKLNPKVHIVTSGACSAYPYAVNRCTSCGTNDLTCGTAIVDAWLAGAEKFWADTPVQFGMSNRPTTAQVADRSFGTAQRPLIVGSNSHVDFNGGITAYGMFYSQTASAVDPVYVVGTGGALVIGAIVTRGDFVKGAGNMNLVYDPRIFDPGNEFGLLVRVPGSWRDTLTEL